MSSASSCLVSFRDDLNRACSTERFCSYFSRDAPVCVEHGPAVAELPFLGKPFEGHDAIARYYALITRVLKGYGSAFEEKDLWLRIEEGAHTASALWTGEADWAVQETGKSWHEAVVWKFELRRSTAESEWKLARWEVWADPLSAYLASKP
ncbi:hypothetical protein JCM21900_003478 [Sporobolomyces salmonicolor]